jgi:hypothetical protein
MQYVIALLLQSATEISRNVNFCQRALFHRSGLATRQFTFATMTNSNDSYLPRAALITRSG